MRNIDPGQDQIPRLFNARHRRAVAIGDLIARAISGGIEFARRAAKRIALWRRTARDRRTLMSLSSRELSDMGITRCDIPSVLAGTLVRGDWREETSVTFYAGPPTPDNDTMPAFGAPHRRCATPAKPPSRRRPP